MLDEMQESSLELYMMNAQTTMKHLNFLYVSN